MKSLRRDWNQFWFAPIASVPLGLFRLVFGALVLTSGLLLFPDRAVWFSERGLFPLKAMHLYNVFWFAPRLALLQHVQDERLLTLFFLIFLCGALCLLLGLWTRAAALVVFLGLNALHARDGAILNAGDALMRAMSFYLLLAPAGAACSLDRLRRLLRGREPEVPPTVVAWPVRLMQIQVVLVYLCTALSKISGALWQNGTAIYYPLHLTQMRRFPLPWVDGDHLWLINLLTHGTVVIEFALATLLWVPRLRLYVLAAGVLLHLGIEYSLNVPLFSFLMITSYLLFLTPTDVGLFVAGVSARFANARLRLAWEGLSPPPVLVPRLVRFFDAFRLISLWDDRTSASANRRARSRQQARALNDASATTSTTSATNIRAVDLQGHSRTGLVAVRALLWRLPALWVVAPLLFLPGAARAWNKLSSHVISPADSVPSTGPAALQERESLPV